MTVILLAGPGGSGSSTLALSLASATAADRETVLITAAPAPASDPDAGPAPVTVVRPEVRAFVERCLPAGPDAAVLPQEIAALPGVDLLAVLAAVADVLRSRPGAELVVDGGARAVELVGILERLGRFTDALVPQALRILGRVTGRTAGGAMAVWDGLLDAALPGAVALSTATAVVVVPSEQHRIPPALLLPAQLSLFGIGTRCIVARTTDGTPEPGEGTGTVGWPIGAPVPDPARMLERGSVSRAVSDESVVAVADGFQWPLPFPGAQRDQLDLQRDEDALVIGVGDVVRRVELPSVLQRCSVASARFADGVLTVAFVPDESRWPTWARQPVATGARDE